jgi:hypothetical protein
LERFWGLKFSALVVAILFSIVSCGCGHSPKRPEAPSSKGGEVSVEKDVVYYTPPEEKWYKREDVQFLLLTLAIVGIAIAAGAAVSIAFGGGGLHVGASK